MFPSSVGTVKRGGVERAGPGGWQDKTSGSITVIFMIGIEQSTPRCHRHNSSMRHRDSSGSEFFSKEQKTIQGSRFSCDVSVFGLSDARCVGRAH